MSDPAELRDVLKGGELGRVSALVAAGADIRYRTENGYDALIDAVHGPEETLLAMLRLLIGQGVELSGVSNYGESGLSVLSRLGRFDGVRLLLEAGADRRHLGWTALHAAAALGSLDDVRASLGADLEALDSWERTPFLLAVLAGDIPKAALLLESGAKADARGRCGCPPLSYAVQGGHPAMARWLLERGADLRQGDDLGELPFGLAVSNDEVECVEVLLGAGAAVEDHIGSARSRAMIQRLLAAGADPAAMGRHGLNLLLGLTTSAEPLAGVTPEQFRAGRGRTFGASNPTRMNVPFWEAMARSGLNAYTARSRFEASPFDEVAGPVWCADRFGQSLTLLPDGGAVLIGGEHEDFYDPDFCIYNDVFVFAPDGSVTILGYPEDVFPPTDFHSATRVGGSVWIIGSLGYQGTRRFGETPVHRLDLDTFRMVRVQTSGAAPGWIYEHKAAAMPGGIRVWGGKVAEPGKDGGGEHHRDNGEAFVLDLGRLVWRADA